MDTIYTNMTVSVTELKRNFAGIIKQADDCPVAILNHNRPEAYLLPAAHYERLIAHLEDLEDTKLIQERANGPFVEVSLDEL
ncbi:MAG: type II toxin-antitoxin system Phd/YefM family antitoxin [Gammaproteobacteria bacterium]|nr:type II toxin-antitoxin system Phd/YefM family antitoxin [Gammaproteobacteria bacterium]MBU1732754.1 type II toxin-antitoxin system Phd/YefM family antitoxin [Gammaproteobacteria bacterium]MBU1891579.1 type II toxin-antitoxin system Phd/YefM family antitoxin [Gammaproteobacteria bacterium]